MIYFGRQVEGRGRREIQVRDEKNAGCMCDTYVGSHVHHNFSARSKKKTDLSCYIES